MTWPISTTTISATASAERQIAREALAQLLDVDVEHHDDEQEQHHDGADVDEHEREREELGLDEQPQQRALHEREHEEQRRVHGVARRDDAERGHDQHGRKRVEQHPGDQDVSFPSFFLA